MLFSESNPQYEIKSCHTQKQNNEMKKETPLHDEMK